MNSFRFLCFCVLLIMLFAGFAFGQSDTLFRTKWAGTSVDSFLCTAGEFVDSFVASGPDGQGYYTLTAKSASDQREIFRTKLAGMGVQTFKPSGHINNFTVNGPDANGYVYLVAHASTGESDSIIRTKLAGSGCDPYTAPVGEYVTELWGHTDGEYVYLIVGATAPLGIFELTGFTATPRKKYVLLEWRTEAEFESYQWLVQRKLVNGEYETIGTLDAQGHSTTPTEYQYKDSGITLGERYFYRLLEVDLDGEKTEFGPLFVDLSTRDLVPRKLYIAQNFPNPFERMTTIKFGIPLKYRDEAARLVIYDVTGRIVKTLISGKVEPGYYHVTWNGKDKNGKETGAGVFFYRLTVGESNLTKKMIFVK